jgi:hypothetical protein
MLFDDRNIGDVGDLLAAVESHRQRAKRTPIWFRGSTDRKHNLVPTLGRKPFNLDHEPDLIKAFKQNAIQFVEQRPQSEWEWLFIARHHAVPTRLLDWTESPLVGLYFASHSVGLPAQEGRNDHKDGVLWLLLPVDLNRQANIGLSGKRELPIFEDNDPHLRNYLPSVMGSEHTSRLIPAAGIAIRHSKRMQAQHSVFTVTHRDQSAIELVGDGNHIGRYIVPARAKPRIRRQLAALRIDRLAVFPELDNVALLARRPYDE